MPALIEHESSAASNDCLPKLDLAERQRYLEEVAPLVGRLAHDFGNVLTSIVGFAELATTQFGPNAQAALYIAEIRRSAQQGADFISQLRLFSRRSAIQARPTSVAAVAQDAETQLRSVWVPGCRLRVMMPADLPPIAIDTDPLKQALSRLLDNAHEACAGREALVTLTARVVELTEVDAQNILGNVAPGPHVEITVADNGPGLSAVARQCLFREPLFTTKPRHRGLGLAVVYGLLHTYRGGIQLESSAEEGTVARVFLPVDASYAIPAATVVPAARKDRVLVVDDDPLVLQSVCATLTSAGYSVQGVASGAEAFETYTAAASEPFHLVLSDVVMPQMSGIDLAERLLQRDAHVNVLFMSGQVSEEFALQNFGRGNCTLVAKPFRADKLLRAVRSALDRVVS